MTVNVVCLAAIEFLARFHTLLVDGDVPNAELVKDVLSNLKGNRGFAADTVMSALRLVGYECELRWGSIPMCRYQDQHKWIPLPQSWQHSDLRAIIVCHSFHFTVLELKNGEWGWYEWSHLTVVKFDKPNLFRSGLGEVKGLIFVKQRLKQSRRPRSCRP